MARSKPINQTLKEYGRGLVGGLLFSLPMLYTMEMWWIGFNAEPLQLLIYFLVGFFLLMMYNHYVGLSQDHSFLEGLLESFEELGAGILLTLLVLYLTHRINSGMSLDEISGKVIVEAVTVAIGISIGKTQLGSNTDDKENDSEKDENVTSQKSNIFRHINLALCGAILIASNVAPTEEVVVIALESPISKLLSLAVISIMIGSAVLYYINFKGAKQWVINPKSKWDILTGTVIMYAVALLSSVFMLWFFGRFDGLSLNGIVAETIVLGFPATLGASAGRLLIES